MRFLVPTVVLAVLAGGCTTFHGQHPIAPSVGGRADSLQPTLRWEPAEGAGATYDLIVARAISTEVLRSDAERSYRRFALTASEHRIEQPLLPGERYFWAVRVRRGEQVTGWSNYDHWVFWGLGKTTTYGLHYSFVTPSTPSPVVGAAD